MNKPPDKSSLKHLLLLLDRPLHRIPAQAVNFFFVPVQFQVLASNWIALVWNTYMSYINSSNVSK